MLKSQLCVEILGAFGVWLPSPGHSVHFQIFLSHLSSLAAVEVVAELVGLGFSREEEGGTDV